MWCFYCGGGTNNERITEPFSGRPSVAFSELMEQNLKCVEMTAPGVDSDGDNFRRHVASCAAHALSVVWCRTLQWNRRLK